MRIEKKVWIEFFEAIERGDKTYELRLADWKCSPGDVLVLKEWDSEKKELTGRQLERTVTYVGKTKDISFWTPEEIEKYGYQIIAFKNPEVDRG